MEEFKADTVKFGALAQSTIEKDLAFKNGVVEAIEKKDLAKTLHLLQAKAKDVGILESWFEDDMKEFAYVLFVYIINGMPIPNDKALKMAATIYNKITGNSLDNKTISTPTSIAPAAPIKTESPVIGPKKPSLFMSTKIDPNQKTISIESQDTKISAPPTPNISTNVRSMPQTPILTPTTDSMPNLTTPPITAAPTVPKVSSSISSGSVVESKDLVIENLKKQIDEYKKALETHTYENLTKKIQELTDILNKKEEEIKTLKESSSGGSEDEQQLKTKLIVLQSKLRQKEKEIEELKEKGGSVAAPTPIALPSTPGISADPQEIEILKRQLDQERRTVERLREQLNSQGGEAASGGGSAQLKILQAENAQLREEIKKLKESKGSFESESDQVQELKNLLAQKENQIAQMEAAMARTGKGSTYLTERKYQRKIEELESQIKIMKKAEQEMKQRFEEAMLKTDFKEDEGW